MKREIYLDPDRSLASGSGRSVYQHPDEPEALIKVIRPRDKALGLSYKLRPLKRRFGTFKTAYMEYEEYMAALARTGALPSFLPMMLGFVGTNLGVGMIVERVNGPDGNLAPKLTAYTAKHGLNDALKAEVNAFVDQVIAAEVVAFDLTGRNIVVAQAHDTAPRRLMLVDGLSENTFIRGKVWFKSVYRRWMESKRRELLEDLAATDKAAKTAASS